MRVLLMNGPNLNLLGEREPATYGTTTLAELEDRVRGWAGALNIEVETFQSNHEGELIDVLHDARHRLDGVVFNPGAFTHSSYALHDAIVACGIPTVEVHISNVEEREPWRRRSVIRPACVHTIYGRGIDGYRWAIRHLFHWAAWPVSRVRYGPHRDQFIDVRRPDAPDPHPVAVLVHGGFWRHMWTYDTIESLAVDLCRRGYLTANVEYRRSTPDERISPSEMVADVVTATAAAGSLDGVDESERLLVGHSAGGQLAAMASLEGPPATVVAAGAVLDLELAVERDIGDGAARVMLGDEPPRRWSPLAHADQMGGLVVAHGGRDDAVPIEHAERMLAARPEATAIIDPEADHFDVLEPRSSIWSSVAAVLSE